MERLLEGKYLHFGRTKEVLKVGDFVADAKDVQSPNMEGLQGGRARSRIGKDGRSKSSSRGRTGNQGSRGVALHKWNMGMVVPFPAAIKHLQATEDPR